MRTLKSAFTRSLTALAALLCALFPLAAGAEDMTDEQQILDMLDKLQGYWDAENFEAIEALWDTSDKNPIYIAEEAASPMTDWDAIHDYWKTTKDWNTWIIVRYSDIQVKMVDENHATVLMTLRWDAQLNDRPAPIGGDNRTIASLRRTDDGWKFHTWVEAPLAPITYMRKLYELNVVNRPEDQ